MATNSFAPWTKNIRPAAQKAWKQSNSQGIYKGVDYVVEALEGIMDPDNPNLGLSDDLPASANFTLADDGWIGLGAAKGRMVFDDTPTPDTLTVEDAALHINRSAGDPTITFDIGGTNEWVMGSDDDDSDYFKISKGGTLGGTSGDYHFYDGYGFAIIAPEANSARLYLAADDADDATDVYRIEVGAAGEFVIDARTATVGPMPDNSGTWTERLRINSGGSIIIGTAAIATSATDGFLYIPSMPGAPSGTPTDISNLSAIVHDTTNNRIYLYDHVSNAWAYAALT